MEERERTHGSAEKWEEIARSSLVLSDYPDAMLQDCGAAAWRAKSHKLVAMLGGL